MPIRFRALCPLVTVLLATPLLAWDLDGHRMVNEAALASLPQDFPAFVHTPANADRIQFLASEPDRWSHSAYVPLKHDNWPDHFLDVEQLPSAGIDPATVPSLRYVFVTEFANGRAAHPEN